jgi:hypothetical protein
MTEIISSPEVVEEIKESMNLTVKSKLSFGLYGSGLVEKLKSTVAAV